MHTNPRPRAARGPLTFLGLLAAASLALGALACGGGGDTVKIGLNAELTGEMPAVGASSKNAAQMFVDEVNGRGGLDVGDKKMKLELVAVDNGAKADQAAAEDDTGCRAKERRHADRLDILPGNDVTEKLRRNPAAHKAEQSTHHHADERRDGHDGEDLFPGHGVMSSGDGPSRGSRMGTISDT